MLSGDQKMFHRTEWEEKDLYVSHVISTPFLQRKGRGRSIEESIRKVKECFTSAVNHLSS